ncbi:MAG: response regulator [Planctomycetota bacterium]
MTCGLQRAGRFAAAVGLLALAATAQRPRPHILDGRFFATSWDTSSGLPQNTVNALLETADGMIWAATFGGVGRFSGREWQVLDIGTVPGLQDVRTCSMAVGTAGEMWLGGQSGAVGRLVGERFEQLGSLGRPVRGILVQADGTALCATDDDLWVVQAGVAPRRRYAEPLAGVGWLCNGEGGSVWCGGAGLWRLDATAPLEVAQVACHDYTRAADGFAWVGAENGLWRIGPDCALEHVWNGGRVRAVLADRGGVIWFASGMHVFRGALGSDPVATFDAGEIVDELVLARDGAIWCGSMGNGLHRLSARELKILRLAGKGRFHRPLTVSSDGNGAWWVGSEHGLYHGDKGRLEVLPKTADLAVAALLCEPEGTVLVGLEGQVARFDVEGGIVRRWPLPGLVRAIHRVAGTGVLLVGTDDGLWRLDVDGEGSASIVAGSECLRGSPVKLIVPDGDGGLWVAAESGLLQLPSGDRSPVWMRRGIELPSAEVRAVLRTPAGRDWCVTYGAGLVALPLGSLPGITEREGLPDAFLCSAVAVADRWLIGSNHGPLLVDPSELDTIAPGERAWLSCRPLAGSVGPEGEANGGNQPSAAVSGSTAAMSALGGVWLVEVDGLPPPPPPPVCLAEVVGDARQFLQPDGGMVVPAGAERNFVVRLTGPRFDAPSLVSFRWRLLPDGPWSQPSTERTVTFTVSGPGEHTFVAEALGYQRRAHPVPATIRLLVEPGPWERGWFVGAVLALALSLGWAVFRFGSWRARRRTRQLETVVAARTTELREARDGLERRVGERTAELRQALEQVADEHRRSLELEAQLSRVRRLEGLGLLAGGVAHDFNNLLTAVLGNAELLEHKVGDQGELVDLARRVREAGLRGRDLTRRLLAVASRQVVRAEHLDMAKLLEGLRPAMAQELGDAVELEMRCAPALPAVYAARSQVEQILLNLCENAREALPEGGKVTIEADADGDGLRLVVADDGEGMSAEVQEHAFEPFFTTRSQDQAPGLGLAAVLGITRQLGGSVALDSEPGRGARFEFRFPAAREQAPMPSSRPAPMPPPMSEPPQRLRVLLIDDELAVRVALRRMIQLCGFEIAAEAENGARALQLLEDPGLALDVVLSDVRMPGISGVELIDALRRRRPGLPIVFLTGFAWGGSDLDDLRAHGVELLGKPPERDELLATLRRAAEGGA